MDSVHRTYHVEIYFYGKTKYVLFEDYVGYVLDVIIRILTIHVCDSVF